MDDPFYQFVGPIQVCLPIALAVFWFYLIKTGQADNTASNVQIVARKLVPLAAVLFSAGFPQIIHSIFSDYDVTGKWMERTDIIYAAVLMYRADCIHSLIDRVDIMMKAPITPIVIWGITRRVALIYMWFAACGSLCNLAIPALVLDDLVSFLINDLDHVLQFPLLRNLFSMMPDALASLLDWLPFIPTFVKSIQVAGVCLRHGSLLGGLCGFICVAHNANALYLSMFHDFYNSIKGDIGTSRLSGMSMDSNPSDRPSM